MDVNPRGASAGGGACWVWGMATAVRARETLDPADERVLGREPVRDAGVPCPECGAEAWEVAETRSHPEADYARWRLVVCGACLTVADRREAGRRRRPLDPDSEFEAREEEHLRHSAEPRWKVVTETDFPVYGLAPPLMRTARVGGYEIEHGRLTSIEVEHRARLGRASTAVEISSAIDGSSRHPHGPPPREILARFALADALRAADDEDDPSWKELSFEARLLRREDRRRKAAPVQERVHAAEVFEQTVPVGESSATMTLARDGHVWVACGRVESVTVTVRAGAFNPLNLRLIAITNPERYFSR